MRKSIKEIKKPNVLTKPILISGEESFFIDKASEFIKKKAIAKDMEVATTVIESVSDLKQVSQDILMPSLFSEEKLFFIIFKQVPNVSLSKQLLELSASLSTEQHIVFICPKLTSKQLQAKWITSFESIGEHYIAYALKFNEQVAWIKSRLAQLGINAPHSCHQLIARHYEGNLHACYQALEKISLIFDKGDISEKDIENVLTQESDYSVFECIDNCFGGELAKVVTILDSLKQQKTEPVIMLWAYLKELRLLAKIKYSLDQGQLLRELFRAHYVWQSKQPIYQRVLKLLTLNDFYTLIAQAKKVDATIKGIEVGDSWFMIRSLLLDTIQYQVSSGDSVMHGMKSQAT